MRDIYSPKDWDKEQAELQRTSSLVINKLVDETLNCFRERASQHDFNGKNLCTVSAFEKEVADITVNLLRDAGWDVSDSYKENPKPGFPGRFVWTFAVGKPQ